MKWASFCLMLFLLIGIVPQVYAADIWSDGDFELGPPSLQQQPLPTNNSGLWSENLWQETPQSTTPAPAPAPIPGNITSPSPTIPSPKPPALLTLPSPPVTENGKTLIPAREVLEALGAEWQWDAIKQLVTVRKGTTTAHVILNNNMVMTNGNMVKLEAFVRMNQDRIYIPIDFLSQALGSKVQVDAATTKVTVDDWLIFYLDATKIPTTETTPPLPAASSFVGNWSIWISGGYATTGTASNGDGSQTITQQYVPGAAGYTLSIQANGAYSWQTTGGTITGAWQAQPDGRIVLLKGKYEFDWYVTLINENEIKFYSYGLEEYGKRIK